MKAQHLGALTPLGIVRRNPQVPHTAREVTCHPVNNWRGKQSSIPPLKTRPDSPVRTLQRNCDPSQIWPRGSQERKHEFPAQWLQQDEVNDAAIRRQVEGEPETQEEEDAKRSYFMKKVNQTDGKSFSDEEINDLYALKSSLGQ